MMEIFNYIQANYQATALSDVAEHFHLSEPYLSKYIHEKSGKTFGDILINIRLKKAKTLLRNGNMTVENVAMAVGYPNVEHFNRIFKKKNGHDASAVQKRRSITYAAGNQKYANAVCRTAVQRFFIKSDSRCEAAAGCASATVKTACKEHCK